MVNDVVKQVVGKADTDNTRGPAGAETSSFQATLSALLLALAVWLLLLALVLSVGPRADGDQLITRMITGVAVGLLALLRLGLPERSIGLNWLHIVLGGWLILTRFTIDAQASFITAGALNDIVVGGLIVLLGAASLVDAQRRRDRPRPILRRRHQRFVRWST